MEIDEINPINISIFVLPFKKKIKKKIVIKGNKNN